MMLSETSSFKIQQKYFNSNIYWELSLAKTSKTLFKLHVMIKQ